MPIPPRKVPKWTAPKSTADNQTFVSASIDGTIRIWCLEKLIELYSFDLTSETNKVDDRI